MGTLGSPTCPIRDFASSNSCAAGAPAPMKMFYPAPIFRGVSISLIVIVIRAESPPDFLTTRIAPYMEELGDRFILIW